MWHSPSPEQEFTLCEANGTVLVELPPGTRIDSNIGKPEPPKPPAPRASGGNSGDVAGTQTTEVVETSTIDPYNHERSPFSDVWFRLGDGYPKEYPAPPSTVITKTTTNGKTVTQTVAKGVVINGTTQTSSTTTTIDTALTGDTRRYVATAPYWGAVPPSPLLRTDDLRAAYMAAYSYGLRNNAEVWVMEWTGNGYNSLEQLAAPPAPQIVLVGQQEYDDRNIALSHAAEIERALATATQLVYRGRTIATLAPGTTQSYTYKTGDVLRELTHTLTLYTTEYLTAQEFARRQLQ